MNSFPDFIYDFHHLNSSLKTAQPATLIANLQYQKLVNELQKCILLCPNCHKGIEVGQRACPEPIPFDPTLVLEELLSHKKIKAISLCLCGQLKQKRASCCRNCYHPSQKIEWPSIDKLLRSLETKSYSKLGRELGVSDNAIRKRLVSAERSKS